jgi:hypothetical protein
MMASNPAGAGKSFDDPSSVAQRLFAWVAVVVLIAIVLGLQSAELAGYLKNGEAERAHLETAFVLIDVAAILVFGIGIYVSVRRLVRAAQAH